MGDVIYYYSANKMRPKTTKKMLLLLLLTSILLPASISALQTFAEEPRYQEVNPRGTVVLPCKVNNMRGQCRWEKDGQPIGMHPGKYDWAAQPETGDCSLRILNADLEYDDGVWQCQVTASIEY